MSLLLAFLLMVFTASSTYAFGIGIIVGNPTGLSLQSAPLSRNVNLNGAIAWNTDPATSLYFHLDYVFYNFDIFRSEDFVLPVYYGIGGAMRFNSTQTRLGARVPLGIEYQFQPSPVQVFLEIVPVLNLVPGTSFDVNGAAGVRFIF